MKKHMTGSDRRRFDQALAKIAITTREKMTDEIFESYFDALKDIEIESILRAMAVLFKTAKFFPKAGEIRELAKPAVPPYRQRFLDGEPVRAIKQGERRQLGEGC